MRRLLPGKTEVAILATLALICSLIVATMELTDLWLAILAMPVFITAALMGMRRHPVLGAVRRETAEPAHREAVEAESP